MTAKSGLGKIEHMFDLANDASTRQSVDPASWIESLADHDGHDLTDSERINQIGELERLKAAAAAAQARITEAFDASQRSAAPSLKPTGEVVRSITAQVALARRESPARGQQHVGVALGLVRDLPQTLEALTHGRISEWRATLIVRETATLTREDRSQVDPSSRPNWRAPVTAGLPTSPARSPTASIPALPSVAARRRRPTGA